MGPVTPKTVLVRARNIEVHLGDAEDVSIVRGETTLSTTSHTLAILAAFDHPRPLAEVLDGHAAGSQDWIELTSAVQQLVRAGILLEPGAGREGASVRGFAQPSVQIEMLDDLRRTRSFIDALRAVVRKDDAVLDIGTGTGILAVSAALAGAARVFAVESSEIGEAAEQVFVANGVADRVTLIRGRSTRVELPERCSVLVTETIGNDPFDEHLLDIVADAKKRLLTPDARLIPSAIEIFAVPVDVPRGVHERHAFTPSRLDAWRKAYGVELAPLLPIRQAAARPFIVSTHELMAWPLPAPPVSLGVVDLTRAFEPVFREQIAFTLAEGVERLGIVIAFRAKLADDLFLSTLPGDIEATNHWRYGLWLSRGLAFARGESVAVAYEHTGGKTTVSVT